MPERPKGAACKAVIRGFKSRSALNILYVRSPSGERFGFVSLRRRVRPPCGSLPIRRISWLVPRRVAPCGTRSLAFGRAVRFRFTAPASPPVLRVASDSSHQLARSSPCCSLWHTFARLRASGSVSFHCAGESARPAGRFRFVESAGSFLAVLLPVAHVRSPSGELFGFVSLRRRVRPPCGSLPIRRISWLVPRRVAPCGTRSLAFGRIVRFRFTAPASPPALRVASDSQSAGSFLAVLLPVAHVRSPSGELFGFVSLRRRVRPPCGSLPIRRISGRSSPCCSLWHTFARLRASGSVSLRCSGEERAR